MGKHTIILVQYSRNLKTRTFFDYETVAGAMDGVCQLYEQQLKELNPDKPNITYDISLLYQYIDSLFDLSALVFDPRTSTYSPHNKEWIKERVLVHLRKVAGTR